MANRIWNEKLENIGYDETWNQGETIGAGGILYEDQATSTIGSPATWGSYCLKASAAAATQVFVRHDPTWNSGHLHFRFELVVGSESLVNGQSNVIFRTTDSTGAYAFFVSINRSSVGVLRLRFQIRNNGTDNSYYNSGISINTKYRVEIEYDFTSNTWEWRIDDVTEDSGSLTGVFPTDIGRMWVGVGAAINTAAAMLVYFDNIAVDDTDWVGAETSTVFQQAITGIMPAPSGEANLYRVIIQALAGVFGDITGAVSAVIGFKSGHLTKNVFKNPSGNMPAPSGGLLKATKKMLAGNLNSIASGIMFIGGTLIQTFEGIFGAITGSVAIRRIGSGTSRVLKTLASNFKKFLQG